MLYAAAFITCWASISGVVAILKCYTNVPQLKVVDPFHMKVIILLLDYFVKNYKSSRLPDRISKLRKDLAILLLSLDGKWICNYTFGWLLTNSAAVRCKKRVPCILPTQFCKASDESDGISLKFWMIDVFFYCSCIITHPAKLKKYVGVQHPKQHIKTGNNYLLKMIFWWCIVMTSWSINCDIIY